MKTLFKVQNNTTLLQYALGTDPSTVQAGGQADLQILVNVPPGSPMILLRQVQISALIDDPPLTDAIDLLATAPPAGAASIVSSDGTAWQPAQSAGTFTFTPIAGGAIQMETQDLTLSLRGLSIGAVPGTARLTIKEWAADSGEMPPDPSQDQPPSGSQTINVPKFPAGFEVTSFTAEPVSIPQGGSITLAWIASGAQQQLSYDDIVLPTSGNTLPVSGSYLAQNLQNNPTIFTLTSTDTVTGLFIEHQVSVVVVIPVVPAPIVESFTAAITGWALESSPQQVTVTLSWTTANVTSISVDTIGVFTGAQALDGSTPVTVPVNEVLTFTMTAYGLSGFTGSPVPASASVTVPAVVINSFTASLVVEKAMWSSSPFSWGFIAAWDVSNASAISTSPGVVTYNAGSPARLWGQRGDFANGPTWPYTLTAQGFQPKQAQASAGGGSSLWTAGLQLIAWFHVRQWGFVEGPRSPHLCWFTAQAELMGWDTVCVLTMAEANLILEYSNSWPLPFSQASDGATFSGQFGPWQVVQGGWAEMVNLQLPILTCSESEFNGASVSVQLALNAVFNQSNSAVSPATVIQIRPAAGITIGEFQLAVGGQTISNWLNANLPTIIEILNPMNMLGTASSCPSWLQPQTVRYGWWQDQEGSQAAMLVLTSAQQQKASLPDEIPQELTTAILATGHSAFLIRANLAP